ncbi:hypothetical protein ES707_04266 [subsurface metagenome]
MAGVIDLAEQREAVGAGGRIDLDLERGVRGRAVGRRIESIGDPKVL